MACTHTRLPYGSGGGDGWRVGRGMTTAGGTTVGFTCGMGICGGEPAHNPPNKAGGGNGTAAGAPAPAPGGYSAAATDAPGGGT